MTIMLLAYDLPADHAQVTRWLESEFATDSSYYRVQKSLILVDFLPDTTAEEVMRRLLKFWGRPSPKENFAIFDLAGGTHAVSGERRWDLGDFADFVGLDVVSVASARSKARPVDSAP